MSGTTYKRKILSDKILEEMKEIETHISSSGFDTRMFGIFLKDGIAKYCLYIEGDDIEISSNNKNEFMNLFNMYKGLQKR